MRFKYIQPREEEKVANFNSDLRKSNFKIGETLYYDEKVSYIPSRFIYERTVNR